MRSSPSALETRSGDLSLQAEATTINIGTISELGCVLASMTTTLQTILDNTKRMDRKITAVEQKQIKLAESVKELHAIMKKQEKENFSIKGSTLEIPLKEQAAKLFCLSVTRQPGDNDIHVAVARVVGTVDSRERYKVQMALKFFKGKLTEFRSEERRKVLGHSPYKLLCYLPTRELGQQIMRQMHVPEEMDEEIYIRHLAVFRKFTRQCENDKSVTYPAFWKWLEDLGPSPFSEDAWEKLLEEDESFDYPNLGNGREGEIVDHVGEELEIQANGDDDYHSY